MPFLHKFYYALAALHGLMIALFAGHFAEWGKPEMTASKVAATVGKYTGSNNIFSFFAPGLSDQPYVVYTVQDTLREDHIIDLKGNSPDFSKRINNIYGYLTITEARPVISASLARFLLNRYPASSKIRIVMVVQQIPQMDEFRDGKRSQWRFWFHRDFQRNNLVASNK